MHQLSNIISKETAANVAASAQAGLEKTKAVAQEAVEKLTTKSKKETGETKQQTVSEQQPAAAINQQATEVKSNPAAVAETTEAKTTQ
ncbi:11 kDa late embryogenesis abundant protein-like [Nicotiana tomentosiformis]|uniref:11 kDa late embryogenesis abundant protein-like n=1 Tax=Nicotiana tomentosiformis TaxID=4098 RepID=UPI00051C1737|nr:11 kDa late embryogenesis abundant protein-like [Nicotiana tomentosiformis]